MPSVQPVRAAARLAVETLESRRLMSQSGIFLDPAMEIPGPSAGALAVRQHGSGADAGPQASGGPEAPPLSSTIEGITFEQEGNLNGSPGFGTIPPDAHGAAGPNHVVHVVNSAITFNTKAGAVTFQSNLFDFFGATAQTDLFDPRVVYDHFADRWLVVALDKTDIAAGFGSNTSRMFIAASDDADPNGTWTVRSINTDISIGGQASWADFPGLALDDEAIFVSAAQFRFGSNAYAGNRLQIIDKAQFYAGTLSFTTHDVLAAVGQSNNAGSFALQPTMMYGTQPAGLGTYLINSAGWQDGSGIDFILVVQVNNPISAPAFVGTFVTQGGNVDNPAVALPGAPQSGTAVTIRTNDRRVVSNGVWRNNNLYFAHTSAPLVGADAGQATAKWYRATADGTNAPATADTGLVGGENLAASTHTFFPAVAVDATGNLAIGFSASGSTMFPSAGYTARLTADAAGTTQPAALYASGLAFYSRTYFTPANQSSFNRWGDYSSVALDPANGSFWAFNQYARTQGSAFNGEQGRWGTRFANFGIATDTVGPRVTTSQFNFLTSHSVTLGFSESVAASLSTADVTLTNLTAGSTLATAALSLSYAGATNIATLTFPGVAGPPAGILADGNYRLTLSNTGVTDAAGNRLDGDGNGVNGDDFTFTFFVLAGDATRDRFVNLDDFTALAANFGQSPRNFAQGDFTYDGNVNLDDFTLLAANFGENLPAPADLPRATGFAAASSSPFGKVLVNDRVIDDVLN